tara:strand:- start:57 stop:788 length:732 start_codon:yes stop_codon:yes gene_type:complete
MTRTIYIFLLLIFSSQVIACGDAFEYRLFPLGQNGEKLVAMETSLNRYWAPDTIDLTLENRDRWKGFISLVTIHESEKVLIKVLDTVDILDKNYESELKPFLIVAFSEAEKMENFEPYQLKSIEYTNLSKESETYNIIDQTDDFIKVKSVKGERTDLSYQDDIVREAASRGGIADQEFRMNSIRFYQIRNRKVVVINFTSGEMHNTDIEEQTEDQKQYKLIENCFYKELTLYHGLSFDSIIWI